MRSGQIREHDGAAKEHEELRQQAIDGDSLERQTERDDLADGPNEEFAEHANDVLTGFRMLMQRSQPTWKPPTTLPCVA